jgi:tetratricopeptide (TPR) repeat protein
MKATIFVPLLVLAGCSGITFAQNVTVTAKVTTPDDRITQEYIALDQACRSAVSKHDAANAVTACKRVSDEADKYDPKTHPITRRGAYVFYTTALIQAQNYKEAVEVGNKAVAVVQMGFDDGSGSSAAYYIRGQAKADAGDLPGGDQDLEKAEKFAHDALNGPSGRELSRSYSFTLKYELMFHAQVLTAMGNKDAASKKLEEASKL